MSIRVRAIFLALVLSLVPSFGALVADARQATPVAGGRFDLAAIALAPGDVPEGFFDDYGEWTVPAGAIPDLIGEPAPAGLQRLYQTFYGSVEEPITIHVFLLEFDTPESATAGATVVDAVLRPPLPEGTTLGPTSAPGPAIVDEPSSVITVTYDTWAAGGPRADIVAVWFQHDNLVAGVSVERYTDPPADGSPVAGDAASTTDPAQAQLAADLATTLGGRIADVLAGTAPAGVDYALSNALLPLEQLVDAATPVFGGYKSGIDLLRCGICGEENSLVPFGTTARDGVARGVVVGPLVDGEPQPPFVSVAVTAFASPDYALAVLEAIRQAPNDRPTSIPVSRGTRTSAADPIITGASAALAFTAVFDEKNPDATADSAGVDFVVGDRLVSVDVFGGLPVDAAMATAVDLATQQAACLNSPDPCTSVTRPAAFAVASLSR